MNTPYQWHGEPVEVQFGIVRIKQNTEKPLFWYNYECSLACGVAEIPAIAITNKYGNHWHIANHLGIGVHKLLNGGWPNVGHHSFDAGMEEFVPGDEHKISEFKELDYLRYEAAREMWQKENFPEEWKKSEALKEVIRKGREFVPPNFRQ